MNSERESKVNMFHSVTDLCDNNAAIVALVVAFGTSYNIFKTTVTAIAQGMMNLSAQTSGHRIAKSDAKNTLADMGSGIAGMVYAYASVTNDALLKNSVKITKSKISKALDDEVQGICMNIYNAANANIASLADYGVTPALLATYLTAINDYEVKAPKPQQAKNYKEMVEDQVTAMIKDADIILSEQMDKLVVNFKSNGNAAFEGQYRKARKIIDPGSFSTVLKILVVNEANNEPLKNAKCYRDSAPEFKKSTTKGFITYKDIAEGPHSFVLKHKLFENLSIPLVMISHGKKHQITAKMKPLTNTSEPVLTSVTIEGDVAMGNIIDLDTSGFTVTDSTTVQIIVSGNELLFSAAAALGPVMGATVWHVFPGTQNKTLEAFGLLVGASEINKFLKVQCIGPFIGHYIITFNNVEE